MLRLKFAIIVAVVALGASFATPARAQGNGQNGTASDALLQISQPPAGAKLAQTFVSVQYQLTNPTIVQAGSPNFQVQLDNQDPVTTAQTSQDFTGLTPGVHTVTVRLVDANGVPVAGAAATVKFTIVNPAPQLAFSNVVLPSGGSPLPLLSVIGFGVLVGGLFSAMRTR